jgi:hypothetical protein
MRKSMAEIVREYGPFPRANNVGGVTYDGRSVWFAAGDAVRAFDPATGEEQDAIDVPAHAGTAFDGEFLYQIAEQRIQKIDPRTRRVVSTIPAPGAGGDSGLAWAEGTLWVGEYGRDPSHNRVEPVRHRSDVGGRRAMARHVGGRGERPATHRSAERRGARATRDA